MSILYREVDVTDVETPEQQQTDGPRLRERNREHTRRLIVEAYADLSLERGFNNFTMQDIADRVGISHRTLYRYFENREAIVEGLNAEIAEKAYTPGSDWFMEGPNLLRHNYELFGRYRRPMLVSSLMTEAGMLMAPGRRTRIDYLRRIIEESVPHLNDLGRRQLLGLVRQVAGLLAWARMTSDEIGLSDADAGNASAWAVATLIEAAANHHGEDFS